MTATASSTFVDNNFGPAEMAINGILNAVSDYDDMFNSDNDNYPWLAIDLGFYYKVTGVSMVERSGCCADRTADINVRVGMKSPPAEGTGGDAEITDNQLCGIFLGPGQLGTTSNLTCDEPKFGRFVTLQRVSSVVSDYSINWREVIIHHEAVDISENTDTVKIAVDTNI